MEYQQPLRDGKTIGRGKCMSHDWFNRLNRADNMVKHVTSKGGKGVVLHLDNPLKDVDCDQLSLYLFETRVKVPVTSPFDWKWFSLVGSTMGSDCYHFNHRDDWSAYALVVVSGQWGGCVHTLPMVDRLANRYAVSQHSIFWVNSKGRFRKKPVSVVRYSTQDCTWTEIEFGADVCVEYPALIGRDNGVDFVSYEQSSSRYRVHLLTINIGPLGSMEWGRHLFIGDPNRTDTPCAMVGLDLLGINHFICGFDIFDPSFDTVVSEVHVRAVGLGDGVVRFVGRMRWSRVVGINGIIEFSVCV
ncbi:hypothetical protein AHAS_Ahas13G0236400 [Arachis hypogaea]